MSSVVEVVKAVRTRLEKPESWTKGYRALDSMRRSVFYDSPDAVCWCLEAAIMLEARVRDVNAYTVLGELEDVIGIYVHSFNDSVNTSHHDVLAMLDQAIPKLEELEA